jgi:hypothetical protein
MLDRDQGAVPAVVGRRGRTVPAGTTSAPAALVPAQLQARRPPGEQPREAARREVGTTTASLRNGGAGGDAGGGAGGDDDDDDTSAEPPVDDDSNMCLFHPVEGRGLIFGTKQGNIKWLKF